MLSNKKSVILVLIVTMLLFVSIANAKFVIENHHNKMKCSRCHKGKVKFGEPIKDLKFIKDDLIEICLECHIEIRAVHHPQRVEVTQDVPEYFYLDEGGIVTCRTCHDIHMEDVSMHLLRSFDIGNYTSRIDICYECHRQDFKEISPHKSEKEGLTCLKCHKSSPTIKDTEETITLVAEKNELLCNFCHNVDVDNHPLNVDRSIRLSKRLPRSEYNKVICITCHDPHGTTGTINFLRERYVKDLEIGKYKNPHLEKEYFSCLKCHVKVPDNKEYVKTKYDDDYILLCYNCHGTDEEKCHPIGIELKKGMELPRGFKLNDDDIITCVTCHQLHCSGTEFISYRNINTLKKTNCNDCHNFSGVKTINPHAGKKNVVTCFYCHKREQNITEFGMSQKFICLKCHSYARHPSETNHIVKPSEELFIISQVKVDKKGKIKCSTCHDPHLAEDGKKRLRTFENLKICEACHQF